ncbi:hypothetical protein MYU51_018355 [Penicillium brevicompactum]
MVSHRHYQHEAPMGCDNGIPEYKHYTSSASAFLKEEGFGLGSSPGLRSLPPGPERDFLTLSWGPIIYRTSYAPDTKRLLPVFLRCLNDAVGQSSRPEASVDHGGGCGPNSLSPFSCRRTAWPNFISPRRTLLAMATAVVGRLSLMPQPTQRNTDRDCAFDRLLDLFLSEKLLVENYPQQLGRGRRFNCITVHNHLTLKLFAFFPVYVNEYDFLGCETRPIRRAHAPIKNAFR